MNQQLPDPVPDAEARGFDTRIYWLVLAVAAAFVLALYWFTTRFNVPLGASAR